MEKTVYIDLLFLINFSMDFLCFYISARIVSARFSVPRATVAAVLGGIYGGAALFIPSSTLLALVLDVAVCLVMCFVAFGKDKGRGQNILFFSLVYFSVSMALGGFMTALFNLLNRMGFSELVTNDSEGDGISVWLFALLAIASALFTLVGGRSFRRHSAIRSAEVLVRYGGNEKKLRAIVDSGNLLREPISGRACIAVDADVLSGLVPSPVIQAAHNGKIGALEGVGETFSKNVRLVPAHTATGEKLMIALRADSVMIDTGKGGYESDAYLVLSKLDAPSGVEALVPSELLN